ncbi:MAG: hypothetical protein KKB51_18495 [Candidatus Riflebacteria bacterium]|nr:hypothetical protein [Candidatus Riflebacteria bacterium]
MSRKPISMRKIKEILRLKLECGLSDRKVSASCNVARSTVQDYFGRAKAAGLSIYQIDSMSEEELDEKLFPSRPQSSSAVPVPDYRVINSELRRPGVTLQRLWEEYIESILKATATANSVIYTGSSSESPTLQCDRFTRLVTKRFSTTVARRSK